MTAPVRPSDYRFHSTQVKHTEIGVQFPAKNNLDFREASRRSDANKLRAAFEGRTQAEISTKASRALGVSPRQIVNWLQEEHDMPSWAVKATEAYLRRLERAARRIEGWE